jgi:hypothetical protein
VPTTQTLRAMLKNCSSACDTSLPSLPSTLASKKRKLSLNQETQCDMYTLSKLQHSTQDKGTTTYGMLKKFDEGMDVTSSITNAYSHLHRKYKCECATKMCSYLTVAMVHYVADVDLFM